VVQGRNVLRDVKMEGNCPGGLSGGIRTTGICPGGGMSGSNLFLELFMRMGIVHVVSGVCSFDFLACCSGPRYHVVFSIPHFESPDSIH